MKFSNEAKGTIWYGMHFYPGCAEYAEEGRDPSRIFINEDTIRAMGPSFAGKPVFVMHVDEVDTDLDALRREADGWVIESFYNKADGKHWVKFITCSEKSNQAIKSGMRLSNCYFAKSFSGGGVWNGINYNKEVTSADYEHLAIVPNPRYEESVILSPDEFKKYNEEKLQELTKLANNIQGESTVKFNYFKRTKVENSLEFDAMSVILPKSGVEVSLVKLINQADKQECEKDAPSFAHPASLVEVDGKNVQVSELVENYKNACKKNAEKDADKPDEKEMKNEDDEDDDDDTMENDDQDLDQAKKKVPMSDDDMDSEKKSMKLEKEEASEVKNKKKNAREKADRLRNAHLMANNEEFVLHIGKDQVNIGKSRYGS